MDAERAGELPDVMRTAAGDAACSNRSEGDRLMLPISDKEVAYYATFITGHPEAAPESQHLAATRAVLEGLAKDDRLVYPTIRVIQLADHDDQMVIHVVGPFPTAPERDAEMERLKGLPLVKKFASLSASLIPTAAADNAITPEVSARVRDGNELFDELFSS